MATAHAVEAVLGLPLLKQLGGVRSMILQLTVVPPPTERPWKIATEGSSVARAPDSAYRRAVIGPFSSVKSAAV